LSRPSQERPSLLRLSPVTLLRMWRQKFRTKKEFPQTSRGWSLQASSLKMAELFLITTSKKSLLFIWCSDWEEVCRSLSRPSQERPSLLRLSPVTPLKMLRPRFKTRKAFPLISNVSSLLVSSLRMVEPSQITIYRKNQLSIWFFVWEEECRSLSRPSQGRPSP